ncbi:MAG: DegV family protein [Lachnospiraceae bacterium]|nr:DegV family protein [Lachnospiraceae bacterium]
MWKFEIFTDSSCDLPQEMIEQYNLQVMQLEVNMDNQPPVLNRDIDIKSFYAQLRNGVNAKTSAVTPGFFEEHMKKCVLDGKDILYIGFSSGLSTTYNNGVMIMKELREEFPERKLLDIDTLCASVGQGLLVYYAALLRESGADIEEVRDKIEAIKNHIHHQITVDDLFFLKRGGRISAATAIAGSVLKIKPIIHVDKEGRLQNIGNVRGRKAAIKELFAKLKSNENLQQLNYVFISHSDCLEDVNILAAMIKSEYADVEVVISDIGPVIGAHTGPGAIAMCYLGKTVKGE